MAIFAPDLTQRAPRSPRVRLNGFVVLARALDKGRATVLKKNGEYHYNCPLDQRFFNFVGIDAGKLLKELAKGKSDSEILAWIEKNGKNKPCAGSIQQWSTLMEERAPSDIESRAYFNEIHKAAGSKREDIVTWFDLLDLDDYVTFGGKA
jgi:hypothetical protein